MEWRDSVVLITGGTGSLGNALVPRLLEKGVASVRIFSRGEHKQEEMARKFQDHFERLRFFIGDVRDKSRLMLATRGVNFLIHAAALKVVPTCAYNPFETMATNVIGSKNVIQAALDNCVGTVVAVSTDKAVEPVTLYGASKCLMEHLFIASNNYRGDIHPTKFALVRYGNVSCSKGSILPLVLTQRTKGIVTLTDHRSTRFWLPQTQAVDLIFHAFENTRGGEVFAPKVPSMRVTDLLDALAPECKRNVIGLRAQEKLHETMVTWEEARRTRDGGEFYCIEPEGLECGREPHTDWPLVPPSFRYSSGGGTQWVGKEQFQREAHEFMERGAV